MIFLTPLVQLEMLTDGFVYSVTLQSSKFQIFLLYILMNLTDALSFCLEMGRSVYDAGATITARHTRTAWKTIGENKLVSNEIKTPERTNFISYFM